MTVQAHSPRGQAAAVIAITRNCCRCGDDFMDYAASSRPHTGIARVCPACKTPAKLKGVKDKLAKLGDPLTVRDKQVIELIRWGKANKEIADTLHLDEGTVKVYVSRIFIKTGMANRTILAVWWLLSEGGTIQ